MSDERKEMTEYGPRQRLGDYLEACIHRAFTSDADWLLQDGKVSRDERILLSSAIGSALDTFHNAIPAELGQREIGPDSKLSEMPMAMHSLSSFFGQMEEKLKSMFNWGQVDSKAFDTSPWDGSAGRWPDAASYCRSCLIDENEAGQEKTKDKCHLPVRSPGSSSINKNALRALASGGRGIPALKGVSSESKAKAANFAIQHWKAAFGTPAPDSLYRIAGKTPPRGEKSSFQVYKGADGEVYALLVYSNKWADREEDILSQKSHEKYADWVNKSGFRPQITLFHQPQMPAEFWSSVFSKYKNDIPVLNEIVKKVFRDTGLALAEVERVVHVNGFSMMVGKVYSDMIDVAEKLGKQTDVGSSHAFLVGSFSPRKEKGMIVDEYYTFEGSPLPRGRAANPITMLMVEGKDMTKDVVIEKLSDEDRNWMVDLLGEDRMKKIESATGELRGQLDGLLATKAMMADEEEDEDMEEKEEKKETAEETKTEEKTEQKAVPDTGALVGEVLKAMNVEELQKIINGLVESNKTLVEQVKASQAAVEVLTKQVAELKADEDDKIAAKFAPINWGQPNFKPTEKAKEVPEEKAEEIKKNGPADPGAGNTKSNNPLDFGFWNMMGIQGQS